MNPRRIVLAAALLVVVLLAFWPQAEPEQEVIESVHRARAPAVAAVEAPVPAPVPAMGGDVRFARLSGNLFPSQSWQPPPVKARPAALLPPPVPRPPEFPFEYYGRWAEGGSETVFLNLDERLLRAKAGDIVAEEWRLEKIEAGGVEFTYLPLDMRKILRIKR